MAATILSNWDMVGYELQRDLEMWILCSRESENCFAAVEIKRAGVIADRADSSLMIRSTMPVQSSSVIVASDAGGVVVRNFERSEYRLVRRNESTWRMAEKRRVDRNINQLQKLGNKSKRNFATS